ncbi:MAG: CRISPR-associated helicase Cas3' [Gammaproteobacteria bacterium]|nr:CRISPR-associated helicase Cas3' [Gammaproteobacteria bacterium]
MIYRYWGKARPRDGDTASCHLLAYHSLDVAAVGVEFLRRASGISRLFFDQLSCGEDEWYSWAALWLAMHDIGKFSEAFQSQKPELFHGFHERMPSEDRPYNKRHDSLGQWIWKGALAARAEREAWFGPGTGRARHGLSAWMRSVTGHHGQPPLADGEHQLHFSRADTEAATAFADQARALLLSESAASLPSKLAPAQFERVSRSLSWWFAGVAVLADWVGSDTQYFPYVDEPMPLADYWVKACQRAETAVLAVEVLPVPVARGMTLASFFPSIVRPSPLQSWAAQVPIDRGPQLHILEDVTGAGKTEAAVLLAYRLMETGCADGFFIGLPTMATANAMYERIAGVYRQLFAGNPSLMLTHGSRNLVDQFAGSVLPKCSGENDNAQLDQTASARCAAWLADHGKRALLAPAGVGTIDQAMLAVLHSRHQSLRLLGLARKVLIVDEVHACDAYMRKVLEVLLEFQARAGGSAILLSATLPQLMKGALLAAFARGRGVDGLTVPPDEPYPLVSSWSEAQAEAIAQQPLDSRVEVCRTVLVEYRSKLMDVIGRIRDSLTEGKCVCWVRNTVHDVLAAIGEFSGVQRQAILLFHARFTLADRLAREQEILDRFGPASGQEKRRGRLVIATQVIEQSLDVDFDLVVSDLAPIDRLIQRAGRMHRHVRNSLGERMTGPEARDERGTARMVVYGPAFAGDPEADWYSAAFPKSARVYTDHAQLWRTARELRAGSIAMPGDARRLIEAVFSDDEADVPHALRRNAAQAVGQMLADASIAQTNTLRYAAGYERGDVIDWWSDARTPSRLGEASQNVVLARWENDRLRFWKDGEHASAYSTVRVPERLIARAAEPPSGSRHDEYQRLRQTLPAEGRWSVLLGLDRVDDSTWEGRAYPAIRRERTDSAEQRWRYDPAMGLQPVEDAIHAVGEE